MRTASPAPPVDAMDQVMADADRMSVDEFTRWLPIVSAADIESLPAWYFGLGDRRPKAAAAILLATAFAIMEMA